MSFPTSVIKRIRTGTKFFRIVRTDFWIERDRDSKSGIDDLETDSEKAPKIQRAPERRAIAGDFADKTKAEAQSRRNCWRGARSVSPDINPRLRAFVPTSMRRSKIRLSLKFSGALCFFNREKILMVGAFRIDASDTFKKGKAGMLFYLNRLSISEVE